MKRLSILILTLAALLIPAAASADTAPTQPGAEQLESLHLTGCTLQADGEGIWNVTDADGTEAGILISTAGATPDGKTLEQGFAGPLPVVVHIGADGRIAGIAPLPNAETPSYLGRALGLCSAYVGKSVDEALDAQPDVVTGATYSSKGLISNVRHALTLYKESRATKAGGPGTDALVWAGAAVAALVVLLGGIFILLRKRKPTQA